MPSPIHSAGTLLYRIKLNRPEVLLVHPSGNYNRRAPWSIPKGLPEMGESLESAARRETREETGVTPDQLELLGSIRYRSNRKEVHCFLGQASDECEPFCASWEVDRAEFVELKTAYEQLHPDQIPFLNRLVSRLQSNPDQET